MEQRLIAVGERELVELHRLCEAMQGETGLLVWSETRAAFNAVVNTALSVDLSWAWMALSSVFNEPFGSDLWLVNDDHGLPSDDLSITVTPPEVLSEVVRSLPVLPEGELRAWAIGRLTDSPYPPTSREADVGQAAEIAVEVVAFLRETVERGLHMVNIPS